MLDFLTVIFLVYIFLSLYFLFFFSLIYFFHRSRISDYQKPKRNYSVSIVVPCYNEEKDIGGTIKALLASDYPGLKKVIVVNDCSTDNSYSIIKNFAKKYKKVLAVQTPKNTGKASGAKNYGAKFVKTELIGFTDADSYPEKDAISKAVGFFNDPKVAAVSSSIYVKYRKNSLEKVQAVEYKIIAFTRRLLAFIEGIYVTPGPLAIYTKRAFDEVGGFDETNLTEDIEITWAFVARGYKIEMSHSARVYSVAPFKFKPWFKQRIRLNVGGIQTINKYKKYIGNMKMGMLGQFIIPFFLFSWVIGISGLFVLAYRVIRALIIRYLSTTYSIKAQTAILTLRDINLIPSILVFFGIFIFIMNLILVIIGLYHSKEESYKNPSFITLAFYFIFYVLTYPFLLLISLYKFFTKTYSW